mgnify:FL=1
MAMAKINYKNQLQKSITKLNCNDNNSSNDNSNDNGKIQWQ